MRALIRVLAAAALLAPTVAWARPPFLTDDPEPTETGHWEVYAPLIEGEGIGADYVGSVGAELNYGAAPDVQATIGLPVVFSHDANGEKLGTGDVGVSTKCRFYHNKDSGLSIAAFPGLTLPTASNGSGNNKVTAPLTIATFGPAELPCRAR